MTDLLEDGEPPDEATRLFDLTFENPSPDDITLRSFRVRWRYIEGVQESVAEGAVLTPVAKYIIDFPIDVEYWRRTEKDFEERIDPIYPRIHLKARNETGPVTVRLQLHYSFGGQLKYHPSFDWNIVFGLWIIDGVHWETPILKTAWRDDMDRIRAIHHAAVMRIARRGVDQ